MPGLQFFRPWDRNAQDWWHQQSIQQCMRNNIKIGSKSWISIPCNKAALLPSLPGLHLLGCEEKCFHSPNKANETRTGFHMELLYCLLSASLLYRMPIPKLYVLLYCRICLDFTYSDKCSDNLNKAYAIQTDSHM